MVSNFGHVERVTASVGGKECTFRSKLEYRWAVWCELRKEQGIIADWWHEDPGTLLELETTYLKNKKMYLPDFLILYPNGDYEYEETKGWFSQKDYTKIKLASLQYDNPITLIFASLNSDSKNSKTRANRDRAERIEKMIKRVIYDAQKTIFKPIKHLFEF